MLRRNGPSSRTVVPAMAVALTCVFMTFFDLLYSRYRRTMKTQYIRCYLTKNRQFLSWLPAMHKLMLNVPRATNDITFGFSLYIMHPCSSLLLPLLLRWLAVTSVTTMTLLNNVSLEQPYSCTVIAISSSYKYGAANPPCNQDRRDAVSMCRGVLQIDGASVSLTDRQIQA